MAIGILIALFAGIFISTQGAINGLVGNRVGVLPTVMIPVVYQIAIYALVLVVNRKWWMDLTAVGTQPQIWLYLLGSALLGIGIMITLTASIMRTGPLVALAVVVLSQLALSMVIEHFGWFSTTQRTLSMNRVMGLLMFVIGILFFVRK